MARTGSIATSTNPLQIGGDSLYGQYFQGSIDEVRIYNVARTPTQIQADVNTPIGSVGLPVVSLTPSSLTFSSQPTNSTSDPQIVTLSNVGDASLTISSIGVAGAHSADFTQGNSCGSALAAGASCFISITFTPARDRGAGGHAHDLGQCPRQPAHDRPGRHGQRRIRGRARRDGTDAQPDAAIHRQCRWRHWSVDGVAGGTAASGTISAAGLYTAPASAGTHTVTATTIGSTASGNAHRLCQRLRRHLHPPQR